MAKCKWGASCKLLKAMPLMFYQALEASGGFLIIFNYNWCDFSTDLQKNVAAHCLATCFSH